MRTHTKDSQATTTPQLALEYLREMIEKEQIGLIGAIYDIETGVVEFLEETLMLGEIRHFYLDVNGETAQAKTFS